MPTYEIRRAGQVICSSSIPECGYRKDILRDMERNGMHLYHNGKRKKPPPVVAGPKAAKVNNQQQYNK